MSAKTHTVEKKFVDKETLDRRAVGEQVSYTGKRAKKLEASGHIKPVSSAPKTEAKE